MILLYIQTMRFLMMILHRLVGERDLLSSVLVRLDAISIICYTLLGVLEIHFK